MTGGVPNTTVVSPHAKDQIYVRFRAPALLVRQVTAESKASRRIELSVFPKEALLLSASTTYPQEKTSKRLLSLPSGISSHLERCQVPGYL